MEFEFRIEIHTVHILSHTNEDVRRTYPTTPGMLKNNLNWKQIHILIGSKYTYQAIQIYISIGSKYTYQTIQIHISIGSKYTYQVIQILQTLITTRCLTKHAKTPVLPSRCSKFSCSCITSCPCHFSRSCYSSCSGSSTPSVVLFYYLSTFLLS